MNYGPSVLNLVFPTMTFTHSVIAEYRSSTSGERSLVPDDQLLVYYNTTSGPVTGRIFIIDSATRNYRISFQDPLPPVAVVFIGVNGSSNIINITVNSHGKNEEYGKERCMSVF